MTKALGNKIRELRKEKGWTIEEMAEKLGVSVGIVSEWERGLKEPRSSNRESICRIFEVSPSELYIDEMSAFGLPKCKKRMPEPDMWAAEKSIIQNRLDVYAERSMPKSSPRVTFDNCQEIPLKDDSMLPIAGKGQRIIVFLKELRLKNDDLVYIKLSDGSVLFRKYSQVPDSEDVILFATNPSFPEQRKYVKKEDIESCYKVVGVSY